MFELSAYQHSDIATWAHQFYGPGYTPPLVDVNIDGGPLNPECPVGDQCPPQFESYAGDIEVDADIETQLAIAPDVSHLIVYNAPNDFTGQTELDEWSAIAKANVADSVSSSWAICENDASAAYAQAENTIFRQMAAQGQAVFGGDGDTGAFGCIRSDGTTILNLIDPPSQPWVTAVGGTSFENFNPGTNPHPRYPRPRRGRVEPAEPVQQRRAQPGQRQPGRLLLVRGHRAGGGGASQFWGMPSYQKGPGVINPGTTFGNGTTQCSLAKNGTPCREVPDISANADEFTPYSEYCTGNDEHPEQRLRHVQRQPAGSRLVRDRRDQPVLAAGVGHHRRPGQLPREPHRQHQPDAVPGVPDRPVALLPRRHRAQATSPRTTACSRRCPDLTWRPGSARSRWPRSSSGPSRNNPPAAGTGTSRPRRPHVRPGPHLA